VPIGNPLTPFDSTMIAGEWQASATLDAARVAAEATKYAGWLTFAAGMFAIVGAILVYISAVQDRKARDRRSKDDRLDHVATLAQTFIAEIDSLERFLKTNDVVGTLRSCARSNGNWYFHPGHDWLKTYSHDPTTVGFLDGNLPASLASYYCRMLNELGRLRWLHSLDDAGLKALGADAWRRELSNSANTLDALYKMSGQIQSQLSALDYRGGKRPGGLRLVAVPPGGFVEPNTDAV
jgi:hypothetical protein